MLGAWKVKDEEKRRRKEKQRKPERIKFSQKKERANEETKVTSIIADSREKFCYGRMKNGR